MITYAPGLQPTCAKCGADDILLRVSGQGSRARWVCVGTAACHTRQLERFRADPTDPVHGTRKGYTDRKCRCERCRRAWATYIREHRRGRPALPPDDRRHGTEGGYANWNCRCKPCQAEHSRVSAGHQQRRTARRRMTILRRQGCVHEYGWRITT